MTLVVGSEKILGLHPEITARSSAGWARSSPGPWGTLCHPDSASRVPAPLSLRPLVPARRGRAELPPPRCLPPSAGSGTPAAPRCRSRLSELRGLLSLRPEAARSPASQTRWPLLPLHPALGEMWHFAPTVSSCSICGSVLVATASPGEKRFGISLALQ